jgi:hypothetical protein
MDDLTQLMQRLFEIEGDGRKRSPQLVAEDKIRVHLAVFGPRILKQFKELCVITIDG